jgi:hypothetical protein
VTFRTLEGSRGEDGAQMTTGDDARFEFRVWDDRLDGVSERLGAVSEAGEVRESAETYLVSSAVFDANPKIRADLLDIKVLVAVRDGFEQWTVHRKASFPIHAGVLTDDLFPLLGLAPPSLERETYTLSQLVDELVGSQPDLAAVDVTKRRQMYSVNACGAEVSEVRIEGREIGTVAVESTDLDALREVRREIGLETYDNVSYPRAIRDILGGRFAVR